MKLGFKLWPWGVLTLACLALFAFFLVYPLASIFVSSVRDNAGNLSLVNFVNLAADATYRRAFVNSLLLGGSVTVFATLIGVPFADIGEAKLTLTDELIEAAKARLKSNPNAVADASDFDGEINPLETEDDEEEGNDNG